MSVVQASVLVEAPPESVWRVVADPRNLPAWDRHIAGVEGVPLNGLREGTEYSVSLRFMGVRATVGDRVVELRAPEYARVQLHGLVDAVVETWVEPVEEERARLRHRVEYRFRGGPLGELVARAVRLLGASSLLRRGTLAQKRQVESWPP